LAFHGGRLWAGSWDDDKLRAIDPASWKVVEEVSSPGRPYGIAPFDGALSVVIALGDDDRYICRFTPGTGFDLEGKIACPDLTGSHLASDGAKLYLGQQGKRRILELGAGNAVAREIELPTRCPGFGFDSTGECYMITADEEFENLEFARFDLRQSVPAPEPIASVPFDGRALAFDGSNWWTSHREENQIVSFAASP
jgi:hypothetical protein